MTADNCTAANGRRPLVVELAAADQPRAAIGQHRIQGYLLGQMQLPWADPAGGAREELEVLLLAPRRRLELRPGPSADRRLPGVIYYRQELCLAVNIAAVSAAEALSAAEPRQWSKRWLTPLQQQINARRRTAQRQPGEYLLLEDGASQRLLAIRQPPGRGGGLITQEGWSRTLAPVSAERSYLLPTSAAEQS